MKNRKYYIIFLIPVIYIFVFYYYPLFKLLLKSLSNNGGISLFHYKRLFLTNLYSKVFFTSIKIALTVSFTTLLLSFPVSYYLLSIKSKLLNIIMFFILLPFWTSILVRSFAWQVLLQDRGIINSILIDIGVIDNPLNLSYNFFSVIVGMVYIFVPYMTLILYSSFKNIDLDLLYISQTLGASKTSSFFRIFLPQSIKGLSAGFSFVFLVSLGYFITPALLGGAKQTMISMLIDIQMNRLLDWNLGAAISFSLFAFILIAILIINKFVNYKSFTLNNYE